MTGGRPMRCFKTPILVLILALAAGCGQKGDLYLPAAEQTADKPEKKPADG